MSATGFASPVEALSARFLIEQTIYRYSWLWDFECCNDIASVFTEDAEGHLAGSLLSGRAAVAEMLGSLRNGMHDPETITQHRNTNILFHELTPTRAHTTTYAQYYVSPKDQGRWEHHSGGVYDDILVPVGDGWLIKERRWNW